MRSYTQQYPNPFGKIELSHGWPIMGVRVDNYSGGWWVLTGSFQFIPPYTYGILIPVNGLGTIELSLQTPSPIIGSQGFQVSDSIVITVYDEPISTYPGIPLGNTGLQPAQGQETLPAATPTQMGTLTGQANLRIRMIALKALASNAAIVWIGVGTSAFANAAQGYPLSPNQDIAIVVPTLGFVYGFSQLGGDTLAFIGLRG